MPSLGLERKKHKKTCTERKLILKVKEFNKKGLRQCVKLQDLLWWLLLLLLLKGENKVKSIFIGFAQNNDMMVDFYNRFNK